MKQTLIAVTLGLIVFWVQGAGAATTGEAANPKAEAGAAAGTEVPKAADAGTEHAVTPDPKAYRLKEGDLVEVSVWREEALRKELRVLPDGSITFPLAGRVEVGGLSTGEVELKISERLQQYLADPVVTVVITGINGSRVYVLGNVIKPGPVILDVPMTVLQALSLAGGLGKFADDDAIKILRATSDGQKLLPVRYDDLIKAKDLSTNHPLQAGDTILVP